MQAGNLTGQTWRKNNKKLSLTITTNEDRIEIANIIKQNIEEIGIPVAVVPLSNLYYKNNLGNLNYQILLTGKTVPIKPDMREYLNFEIEQKATEKETYENIFEKYKENPDFIGLYFNSIFVIYSNKLKGNFEGNWFNIFYNIESWYKIID